MAAGISFGQFMSGMIGPVYGWRVPFLITALPALTCALLIMSTAEEPGSPGQGRGGEGHAVGPGT